MSARWLVWSHILAVLVYAVVVTLYVSVTANWEAEWTQRIMSVSGM